MELKPACDMLQDSGQWGFDILSLNHSDKYLLEQIESYLTPITKQIFSVEGEHYVTLSTAMPKVKYLLDKALVSVPSDALCITIAKTVCKDDLYQRYVNLYMETNELDDLVHVHGLLFAAAYLDPRFKSFEPFVHVSDRKESIAFAEKYIKLYHKSLSQCDQVPPTPVLNHLQRGRSFMCLQWMMTSPLLCQWVIKLKQVLALELQGLMLQEL